MGARKGTKPLIMTMSRQAWHPHRAQFIEFDPAFDHRWGWRRGVVFLAGLYLKLFYRIRYVGTENIPAAGPLFITANHTSALDVFAIVQKPRFWIHWVGKKELEKSRLAQAFFHSWKMIPVDRENLDVHAAKAILRCVKSGCVVGIFPEGTRIPEKADLRDYPPKSGVVHFAVREQVPIMPVAIKGRFKWFHRVEIIYGAPYYLDCSREQLKQAGQQLAYSVMARVYQLMDQPYEVPKP